jgi:hypothetical protein
MSDKLLISFLSLTISAEGIYVILGAVVIVLLVLVPWRPR